MNVCARLRNTCYDIQHYQYDTFSWPCDWQAEMLKVMFPSWYEGIQKVHFTAGPDGKIGRTV